MQMTPGAGQVLRREEGCVLRKTVEGNSEGRWPHGRPRQKLWDQVQAWM